MQFYTNEELKKIIEDKKSLIKKYMGDKKAVIGISGGIDSTVCAYLCVEALGKENVIGVMLPYLSGKKVEDTLSYKDGKQICDLLDLKTVFTIAIDDVVNQFKSSFPYQGLFSQIASPLKNVTVGNVMARTRMIYLYAIANHYNGFVIGTSNKTELNIGYFTKFGDGAADVELLGDLYKTEVFNIAYLIGVPAYFVKKTPSADLWEGQCDEDEFGISYIELDTILSAIERREKDTVIEIYGKEKVEKVIAMIKNSEHKRKMPPVIEGDMR